MTPQSQCSNCKHLIKAEEQHFGKVIACPKCRTNGKVAGAQAFVSTSKNADCPIGKQIAHYIVQSVFGERGTGEVYRAHNTKLNKNCGLRTLTETFAT